MKNRLSVKILLTAIMILAFPLLSYAKPVLFYSDIISGPNTGGANNAGVFVRVFGKGFGSSQGTSTVSVGGGLVANYPTWSDTEISFQLGSNAKTGSIVVNSNLGASNSLPFTVRSGRIFFADINSPSNPGSGTFTDPWRSPERFYDNVQPGDTLYMRAGTYSGEYGYTGWGAIFAIRAGTGYSASGTQAMPIAYLAYPGETVTLSAPTSTGVTRAFRLVANGPSETMANWIVIGNFSMNTYNSCVSNGGTPGVYGDGWRIVNNDCLGLTRTSQAQTGTIVPGGDYSKVLGNKVHGGRTGDKLDHAIYSQACGDQVEIAWNHIYDNSFDTGPLVSINYEGTRCTARGDGFAGNIYVHDNIIDATNYPCRCLYPYEQDWDIGDAVLPVTHAYNNLFINCGGPGGAGALVMRNGAMEAYNNTFYNTRTTCLEISGPTPNVASLIFKNNICHMRADAIGYTRYEADAPVNRVEKNIYFGLGNYSGSWDSAPINADPEFVNPGAGNFHLDVGSPAIQSGSTSIGSYVTRDIEGNVRTTNPADIGAYLFNSIVPNAPLNLRFR